MDDTRGWMGVRKEFMIRVDASQPIPCEDNAVVPEDLKVLRSTLRNFARAWRNRREDEMKVFIWHIVPNDEVITIAWAVEDNELNGG